MSAGPAFDPSQVFAALGMRAVRSEDFDASVIEAPGSDLRCVFFWGHDCFNCNLFKQSAMLHQDALKALGLTWFEANVYEDAALGRRFALYGVPAFVLFRDGKRLGRVTGWPGLPRFQEAMERLRAQASS